MLSYQGKADRPGVKVTCVLTKIGVPTLSYSVLEDINVAPHPYGEDAAYSVYPLRGTAWPTGRESVAAGRLAQLFEHLRCCWREYAVSNFILAFLALTLIVRTTAIRIWRARYVMVWRCNAVCKRAFDISVAISGLILSLLLFIIIPIMIKLDSPGPVFFRQVRVGINRRRKDRRRITAPATGERRGRNRRRQDLYGRPFMIIKFRSMVDNAEKKCGPIWATADDPRITRVGAFLRKTRLDEIPQFINILKGDMSLVGPRPERPHFVEQLSKEVPHFLDRLQVTPGITGLAQVRNGYDSSVDSVHKKISYDLTYIRYWNIWTDLRILVATILVVLTGRGAN